MDAASAVDAAVIVAKVAADVPTTARKVVMLRLPHLHQLRLLHLLQPLLLQPLPLDFLKPDSHNIQPLNKEK